ncbi:torsin interacting protein isoform 2-T2 [Aphomia sociella]
MGGYGLTKNSSSCKGTNKSTPNQQGVDEIDNVMSKLSKPINKPSSPLAFNKHRRNSLSPPNISETEDSDSNDEFGYSVHSDHINHTPQDLSPNTREPYIILERAINKDYRFDSLSNKSTSFQDRSRNQEKKNSKVPALLIPLIVILIAVVIYARDNMTPLNIIKGKNSIVYDELKFHTDINNLRRKYKVTDDTILKVQSGISTIYKNEDTGSFIFVYNSKSNNFNPMELDKFINDVAATSAQYLRNDSMPVQHLAVASSSLNMHNYNELIKKYQDDVDRSGVMLITEIDKVPSSLAMAFHYYCDEYNPVVKKSAIFFTLNLARCSNMSDQLSKHAIIEKCLENKWYSDISQENMAPLLNRVVNIVIDVTSVRLKEP